MIMKSVAPVLLLAAALLGAAVASAPDCPPKITSVDTNATLSNNRRFQVPDAGTDPELIHEPLGDVDGDGKPDHTMRSASGNVGGSSNRGVIYVVMSRFSHAQTPGGSVLKDMDPTQHLPDGVLAIYGAQSLGFAEVQAGNFSDGPSVDLLIRDEDEGVFVVLDVAALLSDSSRSRAVELDPANLPPYIFGAVGAGAKRGGKRVSRVSLNATLDALLVESDSLASGRGGVFFVKIPTVVPHESGSTHPAIVLDRSVHAPGVFGFVGVSTDVKLAHGPTLWGSIFHGSTGLDLVLQSSKTTLSLPGGVLKSQAGAVFLVKWDLIAQLATEEDVVEIDPAALPKQTLAFGAGAQDDKLGEEGVTLELLDDDDLLDVVVRTPTFNSDSASNVGAVAALCSRGLPDPPTESGSTISIISASEALPGVLLLLGSGDQGSLGQEELLIAALGEGGARALVLSYPNLLLGTADAAVGGVFVIHPAVLNDLESGSNIVFQSASLPAGVTGFLGAESQGAVLRLERVHNFGDGPRLIMSTPFEAAGTSATPGAVYIAEVPSIAGGEQGDSPVQLDNESGTAGIATFVLPVADDASEIEYTLDVAFLGSPSQTALVLGPSELDDEARNKAGGVYILHPALIEGSMGAVVTVDGTDSQSGLVRIVGAAEDAYLAGRSFQVADVDGNGANDLVLLSPDFAQRRGALEDEGPAGSIVLVHDSLLGPQEDTVHVPIDLDDLPNGVMVLVGSCEESEMGSGQIDVSSFAASAVPRFIASAPGSNCIASQDGGDDRGAVYIVDAGAGGLNFGPASASTVFLEAGSLPAGVVGIFGGQDYLRVGDQAPVVGDVGGSAELDLLLPMMDFTPELLGEEIEGAGAVAVFLDPLLHSSESAPAHALGMDSMPDGSYLLVASTESENLGRDVRTEGKQVAITSDHGVNVLDFTLSHSWLSSLSVNEPLADEAPSPLEDSPPGQVVARLTALDDDFASASDVPQLNLISTIEALNDEGALAIPTVQTAVEVPEAGTATFTLSLPSGVSYKLLASAMAGSDAEPVNATLLATLRAGSRPDLDLQLAARLCDQAVPRTVPVPLAVREAAGPITVDAFAEGSRDHYITVLEGEPTVNATFDVVLRDGSIQHQADALKARIVVTSTDPMWDPLKDSDDVLQPGSSALGITIGTPAVVAGSATYTVTVATTNLDYEALAGALADFTTSSAPDIVLDFVVQFEVLPGVWGAASEPATLTLSNAVEPPASITGSDIAVTENVEEEFPGAVSYPMVSVWDSIGLTFHVISTIDSNNTGSTMADGRRALDVSLVAMTASEVTTSSASISAGAIDTEALQAHAGVNLMAPDHPETFFFPIKFVACGPSSCVDSQQHDLIVTDVVEPELDIESFPQSLTYTIDEATLGPVTPVVQDFYIRLHDLNRPGNLLDFTLTLAGPSGGTVPEPLQGLTASCGTFTHTSANAYVEATCSIDTADASWDLEALRLAVEGTVTSPSPLTGQHYSVEGALGEAPLRVVVSSSIPEQDNAQGPAYDVLVADMDEDPLELALDEAELFTCLEGVDTAQIMMVVPGYDPDFSLETVDGFGTFSVRPEDVTITTSFGSTSLPTLTTTAEVTGPHDISNKGTRFNVVILCGAHLDFEALVAASSQSPSAGLLHLPTLSHDLTVPLYDYIGGGVIQPIVTTVTGGQFGDVNEEPIPSGALRSRAFTVVENGDPGAPLGQLTAFHVDEGDSLSSVVVHSAGDSLAAELTSAGVWALLAVKGFDYEATSPWQGGAAGHQERRLPVAFNVNDPCGAVSVPGAATADFSNNDTYMGANQVPPNISHAAAPTPPEGSRVVPFCVELTDDGDNLDAAGGAKTTLVPAYLYILDANDPPKLANTNPDPEGEPTYTDHIMLAENSDVGVPFGVIRVADEDGDELSSIQVLGVGSEHFEFVRSGTVWRIHAKTRFDFENPPARPDGSERSNTWELLVLLTDSPAEETPASQGVLVTVTIEDVNEAPTYTGPSTFTVEENSAVGTVVGALTFTDPEGHAVTATLSPASAPFALVATGTGYDLTTAGVLDWESGTTQYTLTLSGQDAGSPAQPVSASMVVNVANVEEAAPSPAAPAAAATSKAKKDGNLIATGIGVALVAALVVVVIIFLAYRAGHCSGCTRGYTNMDTEGRAEPSATAPERDRSDSAVAWA